MKDILSEKVYEPPNVEVWHVEVELGFSESDPGGISVPDMPIVPF